MSENSNRVLRRGGILVSPPSCPQPLHSSLPFKLCERDWKKERDRKREENTESERERKREREREETDWREGEGTLRYDWRKERDRKRGRNRESEREKRREKEADEGEGTPTQDTNMWYNEAHSFDF